MSAISIALGIGLLAVVIWPRLYRFLRILRVPGPLLPPGTKGHLVDFMLKPLTFGPSMAAQYGPLYRFYNSNFGTQLAIADPGLAHELYSKQGVMAKAKDAGFGAFFERFIGQCMGLVSGKKWTNIRKVFKTALSTATADASLANIEESLEQWERDVLEPLSKSGVDVNLHELVGMMPVRVMLNIFFGHKFVTRHFPLLECLYNDAKQIIDTVIYNHLACTSLYKYVPSKENDTMEQYHSNWNKVLTAYESSQERADGEGGIFDHVLDHMTSSSKNEVSFKEVADTLSEIIFTNEDVLSPQMCWMIADMLVYPQLAEALGLGCQDHMIDGVSLKQQHPQLLHFIRESNRIHPPIPVSLPDILKQDIQLGGFTLPKGTYISIDLYSINNTQKYWSQPFEFQPDRFENLDSFHDKWAAFRFGFGARNCPGKYYGNLVLANVLARILSRWRLIPLDMDYVNHHSQMPRMQGNFENVPAVKVRVERRKLESNKSTEGLVKEPIVTCQEDTVREDNITVSNDYDIQVEYNHENFLSFGTPIFKNGSHINDLTTQPCLVGVSVIPSSPLLQLSGSRQLISFLGSLPQPSLICVGDTLNIHNIKAMKKNANVQYSHDTVMGLALEKSVPFFETIGLAIRELEAQRPEKSGWIKLVSWTDIEGEQMKMGQQIVRKYYNNFAPFKTSIDEIALKFLKYRRPMSKNHSARLPYMVSYLLDELPFVLHGVNYDGVEYSSLLYPTTWEAMEKRIYDLFDLKHDISSKKEFADFREAVNAAFDGQEKNQGTIFLPLGQKNAWKRSTGG